MKNWFVELETGVTLSPVLSLSDFSQSFIVETTSSSIAVEAVISQMGEGGRVYPIHFSILTVNNAKR